MPSPSKGAIARAEALAAGHENWPNVTRWPLGSAWIGRVDGHSIGLPSEEAAMEVLAVIEKHDPEGVERGDYFIDVERGEGDHAA